MLLVPPGLDRPAGPDRGTAVPGLLGGALAPGIVLWLAIAGFGLLLTGPFKGWDRSESDLNRTLQVTRTGTWDSVMALWSHVANTETIIGVCAVVVAVLWWRTRRWWFAVVRAIAVSLQATIFVTVSAVIGRLRPDVPHLDPAPPTSSYPSGHARASVLCRGIHHLSDVIVGAINGLACAGLAAGCLVHRRGEATETDGQVAVGEKHGPSAWPKRMTLKTSTERR